MANETEIEKLIDLIRERRFLYDLTDNDHKNREKREEAWIAIAEEMAYENAEFWKNKWKMLKDNYNKYKKAKLAPTCVAYKKYRNWPWSDLMAFLDGVIYTRTPIGTVYTNKDDKNEPTASTSQNTIQVKQENIAEEENNEIVIEQEKKENKAERQRKVFARYYRVPIKRKAVLSPETKAVLDYVKSSNDKSMMNFDETDLFFLSYAKNFKRFSGRSQALLKLEIASAFARYEMLENGSEFMNINGDPLHYANENSN